MSIQKLYLYLEVPSLIEKLKRKLISDIPGLALKILQRASSVALSICSIVKCSWKIGAKRRMSLLVIQRSPLRTSFVNFMNSVIVALVAAFCFF